MSNKSGPKSKPTETLSTSLDGMPDPPKYLDRVAKLHWKELTALLAEAGILSRLDQDALGQYCMLYSRWREAEAKIAVEGCVIVAVNGYAQKNPWYSISMECQKDMKSCWAMFGLTVQARAKLSIEKVEPIDPKWIF